MPLAAAAGGDVASALIELGAVVLALGIGARGATRFGLSPIAFYLLVGLAFGALGPTELTEGFVEIAATIGVVLLLLILGLEYTAEELTASLRTNLPVGAFDAALNALPGFVFGLLLGWDLLAAVVLAGVTWISSSGIIAKALADLGRLGNRETPIVLSVLVIEDLAMAVYLPVIASLLVGGGVLATAGSLAVAVVAAAVALVAALRYGERIGRLISHQSAEALLLTALGVSLLVAGVAESLQVSAAVGAFLVGIALSGEVAERAEAMLAPLRDLTAALFFVFFGLSIDTGTLPEVAGAALLLAALTTVTKMVTGWWAAGRAGIGEAGRARAATTLVARGEFSIVIAGIGASAHPDLAPLAAAYVLVLAVAGPLLMRFPSPVVALAGRRG